MSSPLEPHIKFWHPAEIEKAVLEVGMLPFFENDISGFSVAEHTPAELWFNDEQEGPWEWKGPIIQLGHTAYGKFFNRKAGWVALEWLPDLVNLRRATYPLPPEDSQAPERLIYEVLCLDRDVLSRDLKREVGLFGMKLKSTFERYIAQLQMGLWACISDFEYNIDQHGNRYGWGVAEYSTPEVAACRATFEDGADSNGKTGLETAEIKEVARNHKLRVSRIESIGSRHPFYFNL